MAESGILSLSYEHYILSKSCYPDGPTPISYIPLERRITHLFNVVSFAMIDVYITDLQVKLQPYPLIPICQKRTFSKPYPSVVHELVKN